jgi:flagellar protein FliO/FliZ
MMGQTLLVVVLFVAVLSMVPWLIKWVQRRVSGGLQANVSGSRLVSVVAVGPQQKVVTVEVGPDNARTWLVLGVTSQNITCLHSGPILAAQPSYATVASSLHDQGLSGV